MLLAVQLNYILHIVEVRYTADSLEGQRAGSLLAGGFFGVLFAITGDLEYMAKTLGLPRFSSATNPCCLCRCLKHGPMTLTDCRYPLAPWLGTMWNPLEWKAWEDRCKNKLFDIPGVSGLTVAYDYMHCKYLGVDQYVFGSVLYLLCFFVLGGSPTENLARVWGWIKSHYKTNKVTTKYRQIYKLSMFVRKSGFAKLRGKAAEIKSMASVMLALWEAHMDVSSRVHKQIKLLLSLSHKLDVILSEHPLAEGYFKLPDEAARRFTNTAFNLGSILKQLSEHFQHEGIKVFNFVPKTHMLLHCALIAKHLHPGLTWCFAGEDMMRKVQCLIQSCVRGNGPARSITKATDHYVLAMHLRFVEDSKI